MGVTHLNSLTPLVLTFVREEAAHKGNGIQNVPAAVMGPRAEISQDGQFYNANWAPLHQWLVDNGDEGYEAAADGGHHDAGGQIGVLHRM